MAEGRRSRRSGIGRPEARKAPSLSARTKPTGHKLSATPRPPQPPHREIEAERILDERAAFDGAVSERELRQKVALAARPSVAPIAWPPPHTTPPKITIAPRPAPIKPPTTPEPGSCAWHSSMGHHVSASLRRIANRDGVLKWQ